MGPLFVLVFLLFGTVSSFITVPEDVIVHSGEQSQITCTYRGTDAQNVRLDWKQLPGNVSTTGGQNTTCRFSTLSIAYKLQGLENLYEKKLQCIVHELPTSAGTIAQIGSAVSRFTVCPSEHLHASPLQRSETTGLVDFSVNYTTMCKTALRCEVEIN